MSINAVISGTGSYLPEKKIPNEAFLSNTFYNSRGERITKPTQEIVKKLGDISGIYERRYISDRHDSADMGAIAGLRAVESAGVDGETIDSIIVAHNFGNMEPGKRTSHLIPNLAALIKHKMGIKNPLCTAFDVLYGCPGWLLAMNQAFQAIAVGHASRVLVVGVEVISRILDPHDMDSMLFGDGAGAVVLEGEESDERKGVLCYQAYSHCEEEVEFLEMGSSYYEGAAFDTTVKMKGKNVYRYAVNYVPDIITTSLEDVGIPLSKISKILVHQANEKMLLAIGEKLCTRHELELDLCKVMPITLRNLGNASVATIPTLLDMIMRQEMNGHTIEPGETVVMASVGAGMHANCMIYTF